MFSAILLSFGRGSGWDQLLYVITELLASFLRPIPRFEPLCMGACNVRPPLTMHRTELVLRRQTLTRERREHEAHMEGHGFW